MIPTSGSYPSWESVMSSPHLGQSFSLAILVLHVPRGILRAEHVPLLRSVQLVKCLLPLRQLTVANRVVLPPQAREAVAHVPRHHLHAYQPLLIRQRRVIRADALWDRPAAHVRLKPEDVRRDLLVERRHRRVPDRAALAALAHGCQVDLPWVIGG